MWQWTDLSVIDLSSIFKFSFFSVLGNLQEVCLLLYSGPGMGWGLWRVPTTWHRCLWWAVSQELWIWGTERRQWVCYLLRHVWKWSMQEFHWVILLSLQPGICTGWGWREVFGWGASDPAILYCCSFFFNVYTYVSFVMPHVHIFYFLDLIRYAATQFIVKVHSSISVISHTSLLLFHPLFLLSHAF